MSKVRFVIKTTSIPSRYTMLLCSISKDATSTSSKNVFAPYITSSPIKNNIEPTFYPKWYTKQELNEDNYKDFTISFDSTATDKNVLLLSWTDISWSASWDCKLIQIFDKNNVLIRNMIPCYRKSDGEIGMYDTINNIFYTNFGTGSFLKGNDVND